MADMNAWVNLQRRKALEELRDEIAEHGAHGFVFTQDEILAQFETHIAKYK
jgi:hypothetical protein